MIRVAVAVTRRTATQVAFGILSRLGPKGQLGRLVAAYPTWKMQRFDHSATCKPVSLSLYLSYYLSIYLSIYPSTYISMHTCTLYINILYIIYTSKSWEAHLTARVQALRRPSGQTTHLALIRQGGLGSPGHFDGHTMLELHGRVLAWFKPENHLDSFALSCSSASALASKHKISSGIFPK